MEKLLRKITNQHKPAKLLHKELFDNNKVNNSVKVHFLHVESKAVNDQIK